MTGGQYSPTTPYGEKGTTAPYGNIDRPFDIPRIAEASGATFTARGTAYDAKLTTKLIEKGIRHKGFSVIECVSVCPTYYGRKNKKGSAVDMFRWQKENSVSAEKAKTMTPEELKGKLVVGVLSQSEFPELTDQYQNIIDRVMKK